MTYSEFKERREKLKQEWLKADRELQTMYIKLNNTVRKGDILKDHVGSILVDKLILGFNSTGAPQPVYEGVALKKDGTPLKSGERRKVFKCNIVC